MIRMHSIVASFDILKFESAINKQYNPRKTHLINKIAQAKASIQDYRTNLINGTSSPIALTASEGEAYKSLFDSESKEVLLIKSLVKDDSYHKKCFYCNIDTYTDLDHFLPKAIFPEFSISMQNLVPSCTTCNRDIKKTEWGNGDGRNFFHPYIDELPDTKYLMCNISLKHKIPVIEFYINTNIPNVSNDTADLIQRHFETMQLNDRYVSIICSQETAKMQKIKEQILDFNARIQALNNWVIQNITANELNSPQRSFYEAFQGLVRQYC